MDVLAVGPRVFSYRLERRGGLLVSASSRPSEVYRRELADPGSVCTAVPGWRGAVILQDLDGTAHSLVEEARAWTWEPLERRCDEWVAEEICSLAEEVHKLVSALRGGRRAMAAAQRSVLAVRPAQVSWPSTDASSAAPRTASGNSSRTRWERNGAKHNPPPWA